ERHPIREPREGEFTLAEMTRAALAGPHGPHWQRARLGAVPKLAAHRVVLWQRRQEIAERMGLSSPDALEPPYTGVYDDAERWVAHVESGLARGASEGWPARMAADTFFDLLGQRDWFRGVNLQPGPLPERLAPASFLRAFARLGAAWQGAFVPSGRPFALSEDP